MSKVLVISTSLRLKSNSDALAESLIRGARDAGHEVDVRGAQGLLGDGRLLGRTALAGRGHGRLGCSGGGRRLGAFAAGNRLASRHEAGAEEVALPGRGGRACQRRGHGRRRLGGGNLLGLRGRLGLFGLDGLDGLDWTLKER